MRREALPGEPIAHAAGRFLWADTVDSASGKEPPRNGIKTNSQAGSLYYFVQPFLKKYSGSSDRLNSLYGGSGEALL